MDTEQFLKRKNPPRDETCIILCGKRFINDFEEIFKHNKN